MIWIDTTEKPILGICFMFRKSQKSDYIVGWVVKFYSSTDVLETEYGKVDLDRKNFIKLK